MSNERPSTDMRALWQEQSTEPLQLSLEEIRGKAQRFQGTIRWRNAREYVAALFVFAVFSWYAWTAETTVSRIGHVLVILGTLYVVHRLWTKGPAQSIPVDAVSGTCVAFHRQELERQRDLLRTVWKWYLGPFVPGLLLLFADRTVAAASQGPRHLFGVGLSAGICTLVFVGVGWLNKVAARKLDAEARALDS